MSPQRPHLAFVVNSLHPGGTERLVVDMALALSPAYRLSVVCLDEPGLWAAHLREKGIDVTCVWRQPGLDFGVAVKLAQHFRRHRIDIIHAHQCTAWFYSALSRLLHERPRLLFEEHGRFFPEMKNWKRALVNRSLVRKLTHRFVAVSEDVRRRLKIYEGLNGTRIEVVYNGVSPESRLTDAAREQLRSQLGFGAGDFVVGTVGRFDPIKNLPLLVHSVAQAGKDIPALKGLLVGDGPDFPEIQALVEKLGLAQNIVLTGFREDARQLVQCLDLFVLSSFSEGTSMALLEAMAAGIPVAVTDVGGNPEIVEKDRTGWVIPSGDLEGLVTAILEAGQNRALTHSYAEAGRDRYMKHFTFDRMLGHYQRIYHDLLDGNARGQSLRAASANRFPVISPLGRGPG